MMDCWTQQCQAFCEIFQPVPAPDGGKWRLWL